MFLGNVFFSTDAMPEWLQKAVVYLPLNYLSDAIRKISTEGAGIMDLQRDIIGILVWIAIGFVLAIKLFAGAKRQILSFLTKRVNCIIILPRGGEVASRRAHNPKIRGSNPPRNQMIRLRSSVG